MKGWRKSAEYVSTILVLCYLSYNEYKMAYHPQQQPENIQKEPEPKFKYPPVPRPYPKKIVRTPDYNIPLVLVAGHPRSGTTLMRSMLDAHDMVRCGEETHIIPTVAGMWDPSATYISNKTTQEYVQAGITQDILDRAVANFLLVTIVEHGHKAERFCNKDPLTMLHASYINRIFPQSKFLFMVRDGRATVHSAITRHVSIGGLDLKSYQKSMRGWNDFMVKMYRECEKIGPKFCHPVYYEQLILQPRNVMKGVLKFLELPWQGEVLKHEQFVNKDGGIKLNPKEPSTDQVSKARYSDALTSWVGKIPTHILQDMNRIAPMLSVMGYDPTANSPNYEKLKYVWGQKVVDSVCVDRLPNRWFMSAVYHKTNDTKVKEIKK